jgi:uncharacterized OB-fold protein
VRATVRKLHAGVEISSDEMRSGKYAITPYSALFRYDWAAGEAVGRFLTELKEGRIVGRRCKECGRILVPPRMFCEEDFRETDEWVYVKDTGTVKTYSVSYLNADASRTKKPTVVAVVALDGASEGMGFLHLIQGVAPEKMRIGMRVKAVWRPKAQRRGAITDIRCFKREGS